MHKVAFYLFILCYRIKPLLQRINEVQYISLLTFHLNLRFYMITVILRTVYRQSALLTAAFQCNKPKLTADIKLVFK